MLSVRFLRNAGFALMLTLPFASEAAAQKVTASMVVSEVTVQNGIADATFRIEVSNQESEAIGNVFVVFADETSIAVGDVNAEGTAQSASTTQSFDVSQSVSEHTVIPVTLKYTVNGESVEQAASVLLRARQ
jgi:hypothetical protein